MSDRSVTSLGELLSRHPVNNRRRWTVGVVWSLLAIGLGTVSVYLLSRDATIANVIAACVAVAICLVIGGTNLVRAILRRGECFEVRKRGLVHLTARESTAWPWDSFVSIRIRRGNGEAFVPQYSCTARFADGRKVRFNALVSRHERLGQAIVDATGTPGSRNHPAP